MVIGTKAEIMKEIGDRMRVRRLSLNPSREVAGAKRLERVYVEEFRVWSRHYALGFCLALPDIRE